MNLPTIDMPRTEARKAFLEYRDAVKDRRTSNRAQEALDRQLMRVYRELARGHQVIRLSDAIAQGGTTTIDYEAYNGPRAVEVPLLAVARADAAYAYTGGIRLDGSTEIRSRPANLLAYNNERDRVRLAAGTFPAEARRSMASHWDEARAMVPLVPPPLRPKRGSLGLYHVIFGPAEWEVYRPPAPPGDPALLRQIEGDLYAVVAVWDLTEVERAVLAGARA